MTLPQASLPSAQELDAIAGSPGDRLGGTTSRTLAVVVAGNNGEFAAGICGVVRSAAARHQVRARQSASP
jgi:hypothetical protein